MPPPAARRRRLSDSDLACATTKRRFAALDIYAKATATSAGRSRHELVRLGELKPARRHSFDWLQFCRDGNRCPVPPDEYAARFLRFCEDVVLKDAEAK